jgi:DNA-binding CsgD family transcriptional regulator
MQADTLYQAHAIVTGEDILPNVDLMKTEFYQQYLKPQRLLHRLCGVVSRRGTEFWYLTAARGPGRPVFDEADKRDLARLLPHVERALELSWELACERSGRHALLDVLDQLSTAIVMVDAEARPIMINAAAEDILGLGDGMTVHGRRLEALWHGERTRMMELIASACAPPNGATSAGGHLKITRPSGLRPFLVIVSPLPTAYCDGTGRQRRVAAVVIKDTQAEPHTSAANRREIAELYELTPAEEKLLDLILDGSGLFEAAEQLGVSRNTARTHMKRIYAKTGTRRQAELVRRLAHLTSFVTPSGDVRDHPRRRRGAAPV